MRIYVWSIPNDWKCCIAGVQDLTSMMEGLCLLHWLDTPRGGRKFHNDLTLPRDRILYCTYVHSGEQDR